MNRIAAIMTRKVHTTSQDASLASLREVFSQARYQHLPVVDSSNRLLGIISVKDYFKALSPVMESAFETSVENYVQSRKVRHVMTSPVISVFEKTPIKEAAALLLDHNVGCLPVVDAEQRLLGIVSWKDILRFALQSKQAAKA
ncbi:MAG: CBS domain-containing protein [Alkalimonas sp.]|nr:CBS domain-containing protein [Alkalimonas sp.]